MNRTEIRYSYVMALFWVSVFAAMTLSVVFTTGLVVMNFVYGNLNSSLRDSIAIVIIGTPIFSAIVIIAVWLVFWPAQFLQMGISWLLVPKYGRPAFLCVLLILPLTGIMTWYSYDYLTPSLDLAINTSPDWTPHPGISLTRWLAATAAQSIVTVFTLAYCNTDYLRLTRKQLLWGTFLVTLLGGIIEGVVISRP